MATWSEKEEGQGLIQLPGTVSPFDPFMKFENQRLPYRVPDGFINHNRASVSPTKAANYGWIKTQEPNSHFEQIYTLTETQRQFISTDRYELTFTIDMRSRDVDSDQGILLILFYDEAGIGVGSTVRNYDNYESAPEGERIVLLSWIPKTTAKIGYNWLHRRITTPENSVYVGRFFGSMKRDLVNKADVIYANCGTDVENTEGAVDDVSSWTMTTGQIFYSTANGDYDLNVLRGGSTDAITQGFREFAATTRQLSAITQGTAIILLDVHLNSQNDDDRIRCSVQGLDSSNNVLIELETADVPIKQFDQGRMHSIFSGSVPSLVTKFRIIFDAERIDGTANDAGLCYITARLQYPSSDFDLGIFATGIPSRESVSPIVELTVAQLISATGIPSDESFGTTSLGQGAITLTGIPSAESFGTTAVALEFDPVLAFPNATHPYTVTTDFIVHNGGAVVIEVNDYITTNTDASHFEQEYTLTSTQKAVVAGGRVKLTATLDMASFTDTDKGCLAIVYYDATGDVVGTTVRAFDDYEEEPTGEIVVMESWMPATTDKVGYNWINDRVTGTQNSVYLRTFSGEMAEDAVNDHTIIYVNGGSDTEGVQGFLDDVSSWTVTAGAVVYDSVQGGFQFSAIRGGINDDICQAHREFSASSKDLTAIATGTATLLLDVHLNNQNNDDRIRCSVQGLNSSDTVLIELETSAAPVDYNARGEMFSLQSGIIPSDVTKFRIIFDASRFDGSFNDAALCYITARVDYEV